MNDPATMPTGPLDSTGHVLCADAGTIAEPAAIDWTRRFRRICLRALPRPVRILHPFRPRG